MSRSILAFVACLSVLAVCSIGAFAPIVAAIAAGPKSETVESADGKMGPIQKIIARRIAAEKVSDEEGIRFRAALRLIDKIDEKATPEQLAAASGCDASAFKAGLFSEQAAAAICAKAGVKAPVGAIGDGEFLKWLFSDEGREALLKWAETIVKIIAILAPLFL